MYKKHIDIPLGALKFKPVDVERLKQTHLLSRMRYRDWGEKEINLQINTYERTMDYGKFKSEDFTKRGIPVTFLRAENKFTVDEECTLYPQGREVVFAKGALFHHGYPMVPLPIDEWRLEIRVSGERRLLLPIKEWRSIRSAIDELYLDYINATIEDKSSKV